MTADLTPFREMNERPKKASWEERSKLIKEQFPSTHRLDWEKVLEQDHDLFGRLVKDILKIDLSSSGRPGPRASLDYSQGIGRLRQYMGEDYSVEPFKDAFRFLAGERSVRSIANKVKLNATYVHRLLTGEREPDVYAMEQVAKAFGRHVSFFREYREQYVIRAVLDRFDYAPEAGISMYRKLKFKDT